MPRTTTSNIPLTSRRRNDACAGDSSRRRCSRQGWLVVVVVMVVAATCRLWQEAARRARQPTDLTVSVDSCGVAGTSRRSQQAVRRGPPATCDGEPWTDDPHGTQTGHRTAGQGSVYGVWQSAAGTEYVRVFERFEIKVGGKGGSIPASKMPPILETLDFGNFSIFEFQFSKTVHCLELLFLWSKREPYLGARKYWASNKYQ